jgi:hypothetical protein
LPHLRTIDVFQVDALSRLVAISLRVVEELLGELAEVLQVVLDGERDVFFRGKVARRLDWDTS